VGKTQPKSAGMESSRKNAVGGKPTHKTVFLFKSGDGTGGGRLCFSGREKARKKEDPNSIKKRFGKRTNKKRACGRGSQKWGSMGAQKKGIFKNPVKALEKGIFTCRVASDWMKDKGTVLGNLDFIWARKRQ